MREYVAVMQLVVRCFWHILSNQSAILKCVMHAKPMHARFQKHNVRNLSEVQLMVEIMLEDQHRHFRVFVYQKLNMSLIRFLSLSLAFSFSLSPFRSFSIDLLHILLNKVVLSNCYTQTFIAQLQFVYAEKLMKINFVGNIFEGSAYSRINIMGIHIICTHIPRESTTPRTNFCKFIHYQRTLYI